MKKIFTLAAAVLASFSLWAAEPTLAIGTEKQTSSTFLGEYATEGLTLSSTASYSSGAVQLGNTPSSYDQHYFEVLSASDYIDSISFLISGNGSNKSIQAPVFAWAETATSNTADTYVLLDAKTVTANSYDAAQWFTYDLSNAAVKCARIYRTTKYISSVDPEYTGSSTALGSGQTIKIYGLKIWTKASCANPEFTVPTGGIGFVGDPIDLAITSKNHSKPVNYAVTVDGVEGVIGTDYSFSVSLGLVQATPLKAGTFVITFSQASDGTYCDAEESVTFEISAKDPVTSFKVEGPTEARVGDEITLTATNFNASPTRVWWLDTSTGDVIKEGATYTFTATEAGEVWYYVLARNSYNNPDEEEDDYAAGMFGSVTVTIGTDATLSDLKVNGATISGFDATVFEYNVELGVYEALNIEATATDAPYATVAVVDDKAGKATITVTAQNKSTKDYIINYTRAAATALVSISESTTWDWANAGSTVPEFKDNTMPTKAEEFNFADVLINPAESFNAAALAGIAQFANRGDHYFQGNMVKFNATVSGTVVVTYSNTGGSRPYRHVKVNETMSAEGSANQEQKETEAIAVAAGDVVITFYIPDATNPQSRDGDVEGPTMGRISKIVFTKSSETALENVDAGVKAVKAVIDGQLYIKKGDVLYNAQGAIVK